MQLLYNIAAVVVCVLIIPVFFVRSMREKGFVERIRQSLGFFPEHALDRVEKKDAIWVHAASVGEIVATSPLIKEFHKEFPQSPILVSVVTTSGYEMANRIIKDADAIIYFPLDLPFLAGSVLRRIRPRVFLPVETELWPNFLKNARETHTPVMMVNGRISDKSVRRYKHLHSLLRDMIGTVKMFAMQSPIDADYIKRLGAPDELVTVTGNTKFDQTYTDVTPEEKKEILKDMHLDDANGIFLAGSTHRGEEAYVLKAFAAVREKQPGVRLVIAPRELLRTTEVLHIVKNAGFTVARRTKLLEPENADLRPDVVILDTIGELGKVYSIGDVVYVGGSLVSHGGHNILEPAAHGKAIIVGNNMFNFKDTYALFNSRNACVTVHNADELARETVRLFGDPDYRRQMEETTLAIVSENKGASRKSAVILHNMLDAYEQSPENARHVRATQKITNFQTYFIDLIVHKQEAHGLFVNIFLGILYLLSLLYRLLVNTKFLLYKNGIIGKKRLDCYVISLGNVTVGGTGKTPTAQRLAKDLRDMGYRVVILNRGYRAKWNGEIGIVSDGKKLYMDAGEAGDEAYMLAKHLPEVPVLIGAERAKTGRYAIEHFGAEVAILDDGFQHWELERDLDILLVDAVNVFGNGYILPRGSLREPVSHIDRADVVLLTKVDQATEESLRSIEETVHRYNEKAHIAVSTHRPRCFVPLADWYVDIQGVGIPVESMRGKRVVAVSAIGNPASFERTLADLGLIIVESLRYPDHHDYVMSEMTDVFIQAERIGVDAIIVTEKDAVKIPPDAAREKWGIPVYVISVEVTFGEGDAEALRTHLRERIAHRLDEIKEEKKGNHE